MVKENRSVFKAAAVVAGNGIGSGVMAIPYYIFHAGIAGGITAFATAYIVSVLMHLMIAEMVLHTLSDDKQGSRADILDIFDKYLFKGRAGRVFRFAFFVLLVVVLVANLAAYISGAAQIITGLLPISEAVVKIVFFTAAVLVIQAGLRAVCTSEAVSVALMGVILTLMVIFSAIHVRDTLNIPVFSSVREWAAAYSMIMFSFSAIFAVPQVVEYLSGDTGEAACDKIRRSVCLGLLINLVISVTVAVCTIITSETVTDIAITGWAQAVGGTVRVLGSVFTVIAMLTSFWSIGLACADIVAGQTGLKKGMSFAAATLPALMLTLVLTNTFSDYLKLVGGAVAIIIALMAVPSYLKCMREERGPWIMRNRGISLTSSFVFIMYVVMALGSFVSV